MQRVSNMPAASPVDETQFGCVRQEGIVQGLLGARKSLGDGQPMEVDLRTNVPVSGWLRRLFGTMVRGLSRRSRSALTLLDRRDFRDPKLQRPAAHVHEDAPVVPDLAHAAFAVRRVDDVADGESHPADDSRSRGFGYTAAPCP